MIKDNIKGLFLIAAYKLWTKNLRLNQVHTEKFIWMMKMLKIDKNTKKKKELIPFRACALTIIPLDSRDGSR